MAVEVRMAVNPGVGWNRWGQLMAQMTLAGVGADGIICVSATHRLAEKAEILGIDLPHTHC